jgi:small-conductance mechanosensitive channel
MDEMIEKARQLFDAAQPYPALQAFIIIAAFLAMGKLVDILFTQILKRIAKRTKSTLDDQLIDQLHRPVFTTVALIGLIVATYRLEFESDLHNTAVSVMKTLMIVIWAIFGFKASRILLGAMKRNTRRFGFVQQTTEPLLSNALVVLVFIAGTYGILVAWDINVTGLVASAGILGLALSFAAQDTLSNLFAGVAILADRPYQIGDYIIIDSGERGEVTHIGLRSTRLLTRDDVEVSIPNGVMGSAKIINEAGGPRTRYRIRINVGVAYGSDIDQVMQTLLDAANAHKKVLRNPEARVRFRAFGDSSLDFDVLCWIVRPADRGLVSHDLHCDIYKRFIAENIQIPFPQRDLHIKEMPQ